VKHRFKSRRSRIESRGDRIKARGDNLHALAVSATRHEAAVLGACFSPYTFRIRFSYINVFSKVLYWSCVLRKDATLGWMRFDDGMARRMVLRFYGLVDTRATVIFARGERDLMKGLGKSSQGGFMAETAIASHFQKSYTVLNQGES
jgi:hypothetical protein